MSLTKYGAILGTLYWCLATVGVDTGTLLASAGLLTLAISFGAKDLVTDLLSGLFIIFEGEFRVGDTISVGTNTGTVMEIGIRTTKINDGNDNVIVLRNSAISNVVNRDRGRFPVHPTPRIPAACGSRPASSSRATRRCAPTGTT